MRDDRITILVVPDHTSEVKRIRLSKRHIYAGLAFFSTILVSCVCFGVFCYIQHKKLSEFARLQNENRDLHIQLQALSYQTNEVYNKLTQISKLDHKLRMLVGLEQNTSTEKMMGMGGPEPFENFINFAPELPKEELKQIKKLDLELNDAQQKLRLAELSLNELEEYFETHRSILEATPSIWPLKGWVTSEFGTRSSPFSGSRKFHEGIDIVAPIGALIRATADGVVTFAGWEGGYGNLVVINHGYGIQTKYGHCADILVKEGAQVKRGQPIATVGASGQATGPHLHYEVNLHGVPVNPRRYLFED